MDYHSPHDMPGQGYQEGPGFLLPAMFVLVLTIMAACASLAYKRFGKPTKSRPVKVVTQAVKPKVRKPQITYKYTNENGVASFAHSLEAVPEQFREKARPVNLPNINYGEYQHPELTEAPVGSSIDLDQLGVPGTLDGVGGKDEF